MPARRLKPDLYTLNGAIDACAKAGRALEAMQVLQNMPVRTLTYASVLAVLPAWQFLCLC